MIDFVIVIGFMSFSLITIVSIDDHVEEQSMAWKEYYTDCWLKKLKESTDTGTGRCKVPEVMLETILNALQFVL